MAMAIERPNVVKVFASDASHGNYLPVKFGTNIPVPKDNYAQVANDNFEYGLESLENDLQMKDLNSVFFYHGNLLGYLFQQGVPEFSTYQNYPMGAVVTYKGNLWIATKDIKASVKEPAKPAYDPCNPCSIIEACTASQVCIEPEYPSKETGWCAFVTKCEYDTKIAELETTDEALQASIDNLKQASIGNLKGVENFSILLNKNSGALELTLELSDGSTVTIPMTKFGHISQDDKTGEITIVNANGSKLLLPKYVAEKTLDQQKGFYFNAKSEKWEVYLAGLVKDGSGLQVDTNGNISVKLSDLADNSTLSINQTGNIQVKPEYAKTLKDGAVKEANGYTDVKLKEANGYTDVKLKEANGYTDVKLKEANGYTDVKLKELAENGAKVFTKAPIQGTGLKTDPLTLKLSKDFKVQSDGTLVLNGGVKEATTNLNNGTSVMGMSTFYGVVDNTNGNTKYVTGVPVNINSTDHQQNGTTAIGQLAAGQNYDFSGWQIATPAQVDQWLVGVIDSVWHRTNDSGMNEDGSLKNPSDWSQWTRESNVNIPIQQFQKAIQDILALETSTSNLNQRLTAIENDIVTLWDASGTVKLGRILKAK